MHGPATGGDPQDGQRSRSSRSATLRLAALVIPPAGWLLVFLLIPCGAVAANAFTTEGLAHLAEWTTLRLLGRSLRIALATTALCLALGYPIAWFIAGCAPRRRALLLFLVVLPFWTNLLVRTYALMSFLRPIGALYSEGAVILGLVHSFVPFMVLPLYASIEKLPPRVLEAARDLGATPLQAFFRVTVPLTMPGIAAGSILVFIPSLGAFATPELLGGTRAPMVGSQINLHYMRSHDPAAGAALTLVLVVATLSLTWVYHRVRRTEGLV